MSKKELLNGIYVLSDAVLTPHVTIVSQMKRVLESGIRVIQLRDKYASDEALEGIARALQALCHAYNALFIIDDRLVLADTVDADGLHIGEDDVSYETARARLGADKIIGVSCYGDIQRALRYEALGADYVAFGSFFPSPTKPNATHVPLAILAEAKARLCIPICAIGGINLTTLPLVAAYDIAMYSVVSAAYENDAIEDNIIHLKGALQ